MNPRTSTRPAASEGGFALIVTLVMMVLLVILGLGLLGLSTITLRNSSQGAAAAIARSHARLALMMAIGELQKEMGPDSRISAPNDVGSNLSGSQPHFTAVYDAWARKPGTESVPETPASRSPKFRGWLASGSNQATGGPAGLSDMALLLGKGSLGTSASATDEVRVPMHGVGSGAQRGRMAWWSSDESMKAKVNAGPDVTTKTSFGVSDPFFNSQSAPNVGYRAFPKLEKFDWKEGKRAISISTSEVNVAAELGSRGLGNSIHDLTVYSAGLLTDVRSGRLKRDLSNLLARPVAELEDKPLYLSDGRMNRFNITADGAVSNLGFVGDWEQAAGSPSEWGINLEELHLFQNLHRELTWSSGKPSLVSRNTRETVINDRFYIYKRPVIEAVQFILSLKAVPDGTSSAGTPNYKMQMMLDAMVALSNPNDVAMNYPQGLPLVVQLNAVPYNVKWNISKTAGGTVTTVSDPGQQLDIFRGYVGGGSTNSAQAKGVQLEPGEVGVYGSSTANGFLLDLQRGFQPSGGVTMTGWDMKATGLKTTDKVDFEIQKVTAPYAANNSYTYYAVWLGRRDSAAPQKGWQIDTTSLAGGGDINSSLMSQLLPTPIKPPQVRPVSDFIAGPQPIMMFNFIQNVELPSGASSPDTFASRPFLLHEPSFSGHYYTPDSMLSARHTNQMLITAEPLNYQFRTLAAGPGGRYVYAGGGRQPNLGGSFNVIKRRIPTTPPLSLGAFSNAIASGFCGHFHEKSAPAIAQDPYPTDPKVAAGLTGHKFGWPLTAKAIGNSFLLPYLNPNEVQRAGSGTASSTRSVTDHSWMANTALWDSWFLSGIVDGTGAGASPWLTDSRSPRSQFRDLAEGKGLLRNKRFLFYPYKKSSAALDELFNGENFKPIALNNLSKYLLVDGPFNVNSTSVNAWAAFLSSVRDQELLTASGASKKFEHPFGTLGYANSTATSGTEGDWAGLRDLTSAEITSLASAIVKQVKGRGPFLSMADFVNRRPNSSDPTQQVLGALQAAIDLSGLNDRFAGAGRTVAAADFSTLAGSAGISKEPKPVRGVGAAGHLSQAALLTALGSQITVRSDTFTIRSYGDALDGSGKVIATAWCEAVVQRVPDYLDPQNAPEAQDGWPTSSTRLSAINSFFGRKFVIQSFRWLNASEV